MSGISKLYTEPEAAGILRQAPATLRNGRSKGTGPAFVKLGGSVRYTEQALIDYIASRLRHTSSKRAARSGVLDRGHEPLPSLEVRARGGESAPRSDATTRVGQRELRTQDVGRWR